MSKGKRKSVPGVYPIVQQKLRSGTLSEADRSTLHQLARLDLIELIENELGVQLKGSQKNSVAAMVDFLLGPEGGNAAERRKPRRRAPLQMKRPRPASTGQASAGHQEAACAQRGHQLTGLLHRHNSAGNGFEAAGTPVLQLNRELARNTLNQKYSTAALQEGYETAEGSCPSGPASPVESGQEQQLQTQQSEPGNWLRELQMQLKAAQTGADPAEEPGAVADDASTPQCRPGLSQDAAAGTDPVAAGAAAGLGWPSQQQGQRQQSGDAGLSDEALETKLLDQLLRDMQLSPQVQQQQSEQHLQTSLVPAHEQQPQSLLQQPHATQTDLQAYGLHHPNVQDQNQSALMLTQPQAAWGLWGAGNHQQALQALPSELLQQHQQPVAQQLQHALQQDQQTAHMCQQHFGPGGSALSAAAAAAAGASGYVSCPLPVGGAADSWTGTLPTPEEYGRYALSNTSLPAWQQQPRQQSFDGGLMKKRDRRQMFWQNVQAGSAGGMTLGVAATPELASGPLSVELSGPSADVTTKRMSFVAPGTGSVSALATSTAGAAAAEMQRQFAAAYGHQYIDRSSDVLLLQQQQDVQQPQLRQRSSLKKNMKGLAKRFKAFLKPGSSKKQQQKQQQYVQQELESDYVPGHAAAMAPAAAATQDLLAEMYHLEQPSLEVPVGHQHSTASLSDFRLPSGTSNFGSFAANRAASAPGAYQIQQQSFNSQGGRDPGHFAEKLQLLRSMYEYQYKPQQGPTTPGSGAGPSHAAAAAAGAGLMGAGGSVTAGHTGSIPLGMPAVEEENEPSGSPTLAAAHPDHAAGAKTNNNTPFMQKLGKAFGLGAKPTTTEAAAAMLVNTSEGLSVTERSNSSFSLFLARVASSWRQESSTTAASTIPLSSEYWPSQTTATGSARISSHSSHSRSFLQDRSFLQHPAFVAQGSWQAVGPQGDPAGIAGAAAHGAAAAPATVELPAVEHSKGSFSKMFGPCAGFDPAAAAAAAAGAVVEHSKGSFSRLFGPCSGCEHGEGEAAGAEPPGQTLQGRQSSFTGLLGGRGDAERMAEIGGRPGSFSNAGHIAGGLQQKHPSAAEGRQGSFTKGLGAWSLGGSSTSGSGGPAAPAAAGQHLAVEGSRGSFSRMLFGPCAGAEPAAVGANHTVEGSNRSFTQRLFAPCMGPMGDTSTAGGHDMAAATVQGHLGLLHPAPFARQGQAGQSGGLDRQVPSAANPALPQPEQEQQPTVLETEHMHAPEDAVSGLAGSQLLSLPTVARVGSANSNGLAAALAVHNSGGVLLGGGGSSELLPAGLETAGSFGLMQLDYQVHGDGSHI